MAFSWKASAPTVKQLEADVAKLRARRVKKIDQEARAQADIAELQRSLRQAHIDGAEEPVIAKIERSLADAERRAGSSVIAINSLGEEIAKKDEEIAKLADSQMRESTATDFAARMKRCEAATAVLVSAGREFAEAFADVAPVIWEATSMRAIGQSITLEIPEASARISLLGANYIQQVRSGVAPRSLPDLEIAPAASNPEVCRIAEEPKRAAQKADNGEAAPMSSPFQKIDRGPPISGRVTLN